MGWARPLRRETTRTTPGTNNQEKNEASGTVVSSTVYGQL